MENATAAAAFAAIGQDTRLALLKELLAAGPVGLAAGDAAARLAVPASTLSFHLRALEQAGLVAATRDGRSLVYVAAPAALAELLAELAGPCVAHAPDACGALRRIVDRSRPTGDRKMKPDPRFNVLFLCTRNSARSIMAEAILARLAPGRFAAYSAGSEPSRDGPMPEVLTQLKALGHDVATLRSKSWSEFTGPDAPRFDFVIALCDIVAGQACPDFGATTVTAAWPMPDPAKFGGSTAERATMLNELYAGLRRRLEAFASLPFNSLDAMALKHRIDELADPHVRAG
jgi:arsenate reductase